jgi:hypothetical protein
MWQDPFPPAEVHFYSQIYHDWPPERCRLLTRKSFESLAPLPDASSFWRSHTIVGARSDADTHCANLRSRA